MKETNNKTDLQIHISNAEQQVELVTSFFESFKEESMSEYQAMILDLYRAITCFRIYDCFNDFMAENPELEANRLEIQALWLQLENLSTEEVAEVAIHLLAEI